MNRHIGYIIDCNTVIQLFCYHKTSSWKLDFFTLSFAIMGLKIMQRRNQFNSNQGSMWIQGHNKALPTIVTRYQAQRWGPLGMHSVQWWYSPSSLNLKMFKDQMNTLSCEWVDRLQYIGYQIIKCVKCETNQIWRKRIYPIEHFKC